MKYKKIKTWLALCLACGMIGGTAASASAANYKVVTDANGNAYDLGGMEVIIRDWYSYGDSLGTDDYSVARKEYNDFIQSTYNFKIKRDALSDWGSCPQDFVDYSKSGGDDKNYVFVLREDSRVTSAVYDGLAYDLSTLDCLNFNSKKYRQNKVADKYSLGKSVYAMNADAPEPRCGVYFNKRILAEAGIDPNSLYDMQKDGTWTWDAWVKMMDMVQNDYDLDGVIDIYGFCGNESSIVDTAIASNNGAYVGKDGPLFTYALENQETKEALVWWTGLLANYTRPVADGEEWMWDSYKWEFKNGKSAFMVTDAFEAEYYLADMEDDYGFVAFPKGPKATDYTNVWTSNLYMIPSCYNAKKAWNIAFAYNLYTEDIPGFEGYSSAVSSLAKTFRDTRAADETIPLLAKKGTVRYCDMVPDLTLTDLTWNINALGVSGLLSETGDFKKICDAWKASVEAANAKIDTTGWTAPSDDDTDDTPNYDYNPDDYFEYVPTTPDLTEEIPVGPTTWESKEGTEGFVYRLYNVALIRNAEEEGLKDWQGQLEEKTSTAAEVARGVIFSKEFQEKEYSDVQYIKFLYRTMFGREADEGGLKYWLEKLENGMSREYLFHGFAESNEFTGLCDSYSIERGNVELNSYRDKNEGVTSFVSRLYTKMLGRAYDTVGIEDWCERYHNGKATIEDIATDGFLHAPELLNKNLTNKEFVVRMYQTFLGRKPDAVGFADWVGKLDRGEITRDALVFGFSQSQEFGGIKAEYNLH